MNLLESVENEYMRIDKLDFNVGDLIRVNNRIREGTKERIQAYEGIVIRYRDRGL